MTKRTSTAVIFLLMSIPAFGGGMFGKGIAGAASGMQDWAREMSAHEMHRTQEQQDPEIQKVEDAHPGWQQVVRTRDFANWISKQPSSVRRLAASESAQDAILVLDLYERDVTSRK